MREQREPGDESQDKHADRGNSTKDSEVGRCLDRLRNGKEADGPGVPRTREKVARCGESLDVNMGYIFIQFTEPAVE